MWHTYGIQNTKQGFTAMPAPFDFANDAKLPPALAAKMQHAANTRAAAGLISPCGKTHVTRAAMALYDAGYSTHSAEYRRACSRA